MEKSGGTLLELTLVKCEARRYISAANWGRLEEHLNEVVTAVEDADPEFTKEQRHFLMHADWAMMLSEDEALSKYSEVLGLKVYALVYRALYTYYHGPRSETHDRRAALQALVRLLHH